MAIDIDHLKTWVGKAESRIDDLGGFPASALAATLDRDDPPYAAGIPLPPLWHWLYFLPLFKLSDAGYDGHAALGGFLPPVPLPRRMWAGSRLRFEEPLLIGRAAEKRSTVLSVEHKSGKSGDLVFVTVGHEVFQDGRLGLSEEHDIVYRAAPSPDAAPPKRKPAPADQSFSRDIDPDPVLLFRYSALTFNGHRIHYDQPFCTSTEGYPGLVVHGPLLATLMLDLLRREKPEARVASFRFRALAPVFDTETFSVNGAAAAAGGDAGHYRLWVRAHDGALAMEGEAEINS
ncbi:MAG: FAS1-like dehydratase domain-containing protein [Magnetovibrionaceae bacterium]